MNLSKPLVLVSQSPQRRRLLSLLREDFTSVSPIGDEIYHDSLSFAKQIESIAYQKAKSVLSDFPKSILIGADTVIVCDQEILGKPKNHQDAFNMLRKLSGRTHEVITGVAIVSSEHTEVFSVSTTVTLHPMSDDEIWDYVDTDEPLGRSGSYSIMGGISLFIQSLQGDINSVIGLPVADVYRCLRDHQF